MSKLVNKEVLENIRKAKYRVKNAQGQYELVYLETSADQVEETHHRVFITPEEKAQITSSKEAIANEATLREQADNLLSGRLDVIEGTGEGSVKKALQDAKSYTDAEVVKLQNADAALEVRVSANEDALGLVDGKIDTAKNEAINSAKAHTNSEIAKIDAAFKEADTTINGRLDSLESATSDLGEIRSNIATNTSAIAKEVTDREKAIETVEGKITAEVTRATEAEAVLEGKITTVQSDLTKGLENAKSYTDSKVEEINGVNGELANRVEANEIALGTVDSRIATAKTEAVETAKGYTDAEIGKIDTAYKAADVETLNNAKAYADGLKNTLEASINGVDTKVDNLQGEVTALESKVSVNESDIQNLKDAVANKNSNTIVVNTESEIATENPTPKVGDLAYVISSKRAYIFKGVNAISAKNAPQGWVVFDEITSELDLVDYLKKSDAEATYRKLSVKIAESDLATELSTKINNKADKSYVDTQLEGKTTEAYVDSKVEEVVAPVRTESTENKANIAKEVSDRKAEITRVEELVSNETQNRTQAVEAVDTKVGSLTNRVNKFVPVISSEEPVGTEMGHVWLEIL